MLTQPEFNMLSKLTGALNMISEGMPGLVKAIESAAPTTNHQRQVAALKRQSEAVVSIDETLVYINKILGNIGGHNSSAIESDLALAEIARQLKVLRKDLTG